MFLALRDIRAARGRFTLITLTVAMLALLVSFLFGLTGGLRYQNVAAFSTLGGSYAYLSNDNLDRSELTLDDTKSLVDASPTATAVGITRVVLNEEPLAVLAVRPGASGPGMMPPRCQSLVMYTHLQALRKPWESAQVTPSL